MGIGEVKKTYSTVELFGGETHTTAELFGQGAEVTGLTTTETPEPRAFPSPLAELMPPRSTPKKPSVLTEALKPILFPARLAATVLQGPKREARERMLGGRRDTPMDKMAEPGYWSQILTPEYWGKTLKNAPGGFVELAQMVTRVAPMVRDPGTFIEALGGAIVSPLTKKAMAKSLEAMQEAGIPAEDVMTKGGMPPTISLKEYGDLLTFFPKIAKEFLTDPLTLLQEQPALVATLALGPKTMRSAKKIAVKYRVGKLTAKDVNKAVQESDVIPDKVKMNIDEAMKDPATVEGVNTSLRAYHGTTRDMSWFEDIPEFQKQYAKNTGWPSGLYGTVDSFLGPHFSVSPEVAGKFASGLYSKVETGGRVFPVDLAIRNPRVVPQPPRAASKRPREDQFAIHADVARIVFPERRDLFIKWFRRNRDENMPMSQVDRIYDALLRGDEITPELGGSSKLSADYVKRDGWATYDFGSYVANFGSLFHDLTPEMAREYRRILQKRGHDAIQYKNTATDEIRGVTNVTSYIPLDMSTVRSAFTAPPPVAPPSGVPAPPLPEVPKGAIGIVPKAFSSTESPPTESIQRIRSMTAEPPGVLERLTGERQVGPAAEAVANKMVTSLVDRWNPISRLEEKVKKLSGRDIPMHKSAYWHLRSLGGNAGLELSSMMELKDILRPAKGNLQDFMDYVDSWRAWERHSRGIPNPSGVTGREAFVALKDIKAKVGPERFRELTGVADAFYKWADQNILKRYLDSGMITRSQYDNIKGQNKHWLPFALQGRQLPGATEIMSKTIDPLADTKPGTDFAAILKKNLYALEGMAPQHKKAPVWDTVMERVEMAINAAERNKALQAMVRNAQQSKWSRGLVRQLKVGQDAKPGEGAFTVVFNGKTQRWTAPVDIIESLATLKRPQQNFIWKLMGVFRNNFTRGTTQYYVPFVVRNIMRDVQMAVVTSKYGFGAADWMAGLGHAISSTLGFPTELYKEYLKSGGSFGGLVEAQQGKALRRQIMRTPLKTVLINAVNTPYFIGNLAKASELATRLGVFREARKGAAKEFPQETLEQTRFRAGMQARTATIDFHRWGTALGTLNEYLPFVNARAQAVYTTLNALTSKKGVRAGQAKFVGMTGDPRLMAAIRSIAWIVTPAVANYIYNTTAHGDLYDRVPDEYKQRYFVIPLGAKPDEETGQERVDAIVIPKGDIGQLVWNPIEKFLDWVRQEKPEHFGKMMVSSGAEMLDSVNPFGNWMQGGKVSPGRIISGFMPPLIRAGVEPVANVDLYWDRQIVGEKLGKAAPEEQYTARTPEAYKWLGTKLGVSPDKLQHATRAIFGSVATTVTPESLIRETGRAVRRQIGGSMRDEQYEVERKASEGYNTARIRAERAIKEGNRNEAMRLIKEWNKSMPNYAKEMAKVGDQKYAEVMRSSWYKQYTFQSTDIERLFKTAKSKYVPPIQKKLEKRSK